MTTKTINRQARKQLAALLTQAAGALPATTDPTLLEALAGAAADLTGVQPSNIPTGRTVSLKHAHDNLCRMSFMDGARIVVGCNLSYQDRPIWAIYDNLTTAATFEGDFIRGLAPDTRLERH